jgi:hypothetical protein
LAAGTRCDLLAGAERHQGAAERLRADVFPTFDKARRIFLLLDEEFGFLYRQIKINKL